MNIQNTDKLLQRQGDEKTFKHFLLHLYFIFMIIIITISNDDYRSLDYKIRTIQQNKSGYIFLIALYHILSYESNGF